MLVAPTTHFVERGQAIRFRGAGVSVVWQPFHWLAVIGSVLFAFSLMRFRKTLGQMAGDLEQGWETKVPFGRCGAQARFRRDTCNAHSGSQHRRGALAPA